MSSDLFQLRDSKLQASDDGVQAIESMLTFDPTRRVSVAEAIRLRYFENLHLPDDEPTAKERLASACSFF